MSKNALKTKLCVLQSSSSWFPEAIEPPLCTGAELMHHSVGCSAHSVMYQKITAYEVFYKQCKSWKDKDFRSYRVPD